MQYSLADSRNKFATEVQENISFLTSMNKAAIKKRISIDTLYAFDNLIRNADRGQQKSNLLITPKDAYLIDHEFILKPEEICGIDIDKFQIDDKFTKHHIFFQYLRKASKSNKAHYFSEFSEYYRTLSLNALVPYFNQLHNEGFPNRKEEILQWLNQIKNNCVKFEGHLKASLQ